MSKKYEYFVSYHIKMGDGSTGIGNSNLTLDERITSIDTIRAIEEKISKEEKVIIKNTVILNYQLLREINEDEDSKE